ncbi:MAG TPA: TVP38/TMEM64 family protein [Stellaceae bacterium]|nr:TVP38/TMEM64 family protein [Stellaceae bacterium]
MPQDSPHPFFGWRLLPLACLLAGGVTFLVLGGHRFLNFSTLAANHEWARGLVARAPLLAALSFVVAYAGLVALSVPASALLTITSGLLFGTCLGTTYAVFAATLGATAVFVAARAGLAGLAARVGPQLRRIEAGFRRNALNYLLVLRLVPIFPFWLVNVVAGASGMRLSAYLAATFFGMLPVTFVYASLGSGLGRLIAEGRPPGMHMLFQPRILLPILGLAALALLPVIYRRWRAAHGEPPDHGGR